jgi:hypothetical protein
MHKVFLCVAVFCILISVQCGEQVKPTLKLEKTVYAPGESFNVVFTAPQSYSENAWVGIIPSDIPHGSEEENDIHDLAYAYLEKRTSGTFNFIAPGQAGKYDLRMNDSDKEGKEVASVSFEVTAITEDAALELDAKTYPPGGEIRLTFTAPANISENAWIGIIPSDVPHGSEDENDRHDVAFQYLEGRTTGLLVFEAPEEPGLYDFRMHDTDNNGSEIASISFEVR